MEAYHDGPHGKIPQPFLQGLDIFFNQELRRFRVLVPQLFVGIHHVLQVIDVVQDHSVQVRDFRIHVTGHGDIDQNQWIRLHAFLQGQGQLVMVDDVVGSSGGGDDDVRVHNVVDKVIETDDGTVEFVCQFLCVIVAAVGDKNGRGAFVHQMPGGEFTHLAGPDDQDIRVAQVAHHFDGQVYGGRRNTDAPVRNLGPGADLLA